MRQKTNPKPLEQMGLAKAEGLAKTMREQAKIPPITESLTRSEIESLRRDKSETIAFAPRAFKGQ
jgi:hypothetical protein